VILDICNNPPEAIGSSVGPRDQLSLFAVTQRRLITADDVAAEHAAGRTLITAQSGATVVTPGAWTKAQELGVSIVRGDAPGAATSDRLVDSSGIVRVRGSSVQLGTFDGAGPGKHVGLADVVTSKDRSPMAAGFMSWARADSFPWTLDYDEIDYVVDGVLHVQVGGRTVEARAGDVVYLPKGSQIVFGTTSRVRIFYVTYPADWAAQSPR
jgi:ethanolamine utilization protein EutQ